jgi:adenosylhomocysteine nucleosidase
LRFLVTFALANEFAPWKGTARFEEVKDAPVPDIYRADVRGAEVTVLLSGVGAVRAGKAAARVLRAGERYDAVISSGLAGSLREELRVQEVVAARNVSCEPLQPDARGGILECSRALVEFAESCGAKLASRFYTAGHVVSSAAEKRVLSQTADVVEMESFDVLLAAKEEGVPAVAIRGISDAADEDLPLDMGEVLDSEGRVSVARVLGQAALRPQALPGLMRLGQQSKRAAEELANFLDRYVGHISEKMSVLQARR